MKSAYITHMEYEINSNQPLLIIRRYIMKIDIGIQEKHRKTIADALSRVLADTYTLYLKTHHHHWNVTGPMFQPLHTLFETQYTEMAAAVDELAERIRALGHPAPGSWKAFSRLSAIEETDGVPEAMDMVADLLKGHETVILTARAAIEKAQAGGDEGTADLLIQRTQVHEKTAWMLRSHLSS